MSKHAALTAGICVNVVVVAAAAAPVKGAAATAAAAAAVTATVPAAATRALAPVGHSGCGCSPLQAQRKVAISA